MSRDRSGSRVVLGVLCCALLLASMIQANAQPSASPLSGAGLLPPPPMVLGDEPELVLQTRRVFPAVTAPDDVMTQLVELPDGSARMVLTTKHGLIRIFPKRDDVTAEEIEVFLDLRDEMCIVWEQGLQSIAIDPDYANNGRFYIVWTPLDDRCDQFYPATRWRLSRFTNSDPAGNAVARESEEILIDYGQAHQYHKGGALTFGPDGYLYVSLGDSADPFTSQELHDLRGSILRIDVTGPPDPDLPYAIPPDNPFVEGGPEGEEARAEIWAYGFRNPYKMSFDPNTGEFFCGDVGDYEFEEINLIVPGANYGWPIYEGPVCRWDKNCGDIDHTEPFAYYTHSGALNAIIGGYTWTNPDQPGFLDAWMFADISGRIYGLYPDGVGGREMRLLSEYTALTISGTGIDNDGTVYFLEAYRANPGIFTIEMVEPPDPVFPAKLSNEPLLYEMASGRGEFFYGIIPYEPATELWSDGAAKERYIFNQPGTGITWTESGAWGFPDKALLIKNFLLPLDDRDPEGSLRRIETRALVFLEGEWRGATYRWNEEQTDGDLLTDSDLRSFPRIDKDGNPYDYQWYYPSRADCFECHTEASGRTLGLSTAALNNDLFYRNGGETWNQIEAIRVSGFFENPPAHPVEQMAGMPDYRDLDQPLHNRVRAYLASNCAMCHMPGTPTPTTLDWRWEASTLGVVDIAPTRGNLGVDGAKLVDPGSPMTSILYLRLQTLDSAHRMPPLATSIPDEDALQMFHEWINTITDEGGSWFGVR